MGRIEELQKLHVCSTCFSLLQKENGIYEEYPTVGGDEIPVEEVKKWLLGTKEKTAVVSRCPCCKEERMIYLAHDYFGKIIGTGSIGI